MSNNILKIHLEILDKNRRETLQKLISFTKDYILGGGTALALQINHRRSFDFDFFSQTQIPSKLLEDMSSIFSIENVTVDTIDELTFFTKEHIKITFLYYPFKPHFEQIETTDGLSVFPVKEIALQKAYKIGRRGEYRDYFDLYTILNEGHINLKEIISGAKIAYNGAFDEKLFLEQLVYFKDLQNFDIIPSNKTGQATPDEVKLYFEKIVKIHTQ